MAKPTKADKVRRRATKATRKTARKQRKERKQNTLDTFNGMKRLSDSLEQRSKADEDVNQAAARNVRELTQGKRES
jgi:hypothetical protein